MAEIKVLIVEDEVIVAKDIGDTLLSLGYSVTGTAASGEEAVELTESTAPDIVLMDIMLEGELDGTEASEIIRSRFNIPVIFLTAYSNEKTLQRAKTTNPYGYILKPFQETDLYTTIEIAIHKHRTQRKLIQETENALAAIIGSTEVFLEEGSPKDDTEVLRRIDSIRNAALIIKDTIEKL
jgi:two-component system, response regulator PdtaR